MSELQSAPAVVVGVDGSKAAIRAAQWAVDEAVRRDVPLRLVYVIDPRTSGSARDQEGLLAAARSALRDAQLAAEVCAKHVKVESEIHWGKPLAKLMEQSRSAAMICVGSIGLNHACRGGGSTAAALAGAALCPVAVIRRPSDRTAAPLVSVVVAAVDNGVVLRHAFEEARLRKAPLRVLSTSRTDEMGDESRSAPARFNRRMARWTRLYPDVRVEPAAVQGSVERYLAANEKSGQLFVTESHVCADLCGAYNAGCSVLSVRCGNL